ncbi:hypothetical protein [Pedobacter sp. CFBP9032]|uniref:hypothetical protein n=1 Tax=Pedobacter sp. CFBP9032 TaxID=3096539 RepID=UPI002A6A3A1B|nr:hypothetical protein [Pedobacter sp. CFBP9032]MDY0904217.1 hypothetical protein [Pedobacter sp. CFBP9032]
MKKNKTKLKLFGAIVLSLVISCKKDLSNSQKDLEILQPKSKTVELQTSFAKILAKALSSEEDLRDFIRVESLKEFDRDNDILYHQIKDVEVSNGKSFRSKLLNYTTEGELSKVESELPLLTIFVPTLPNFNPMDWNTKTEIPMIAVSNMDKIGSVSIYDEKEEEIKLNPEQIPGFPVLVIKENERVIVKRSNNKLAVKNNTTKSLSGTSNNYSYEFIDEAYDGSLVDKSLGIKSSISLSKEQNGKISRLAPGPNLLNPNAIDQVNVDAYNSGNEWHRDYVYYGITSSNPNGKFRNYYSEYITSFKFLTPSALGIISDQDGDPRMNNYYGTGTSAPTTMWTDGNFEFRISVLINAKNGSGNEFVRQMSVRPTELFDLQYELIMDEKFFKIKLYEFRNAIPKEYHPNIELLPWDLENYGTAWKFIFYEVDGTQEETKSYENTTTFATNFEINSGGDKTKVGFKFGASATTSEKRTYSIKTMLGSDNLAEAILTFDQPVIIGTSSNNYITREITNGNVLSISVEPRRNNSAIN